MCDFVRRVERIVGTHGVFRVRSAGIVTVEDAARAVIREVLEELEAEDDDMAICGYETIGRAVGAGESFGAALAAWKRARDLA